MQRALQTSLYCSVAILLRPTYIKFTIDKSSLEEAVSGNVIDVINKLTSIVTKVVQVLLKQGPTLTSLLCNHCANIEPYSIILDLEFNIPKLSNEDECELSFGTLMYAISLYARALLHVSKLKSFCETEEPNVGRNFKKGYKSP